MVIVRFCTVILIFILFLGHFCILFGRNVLNCRFLLFLSKNDGGKKEAGPRNEFVQNRW